MSTFPTPPGRFGVVGALTALGWFCACQSPPPEPSTCTPGEVVCGVGVDIRVCNERGDGWIDSACAADQTCVPGDCGDPAVCPDACVERRCVPGERYCGADNIFVYECDATGTAGCFVESCAVAPNDGVCFAGNCVRTCGEGQKSYLGCEYFAADLDNAAVPCSSPTGFCDAAAEQYAVVVSNTSPTELAHVIVTQGELPVPDVVTSCRREGEVPLPNNFVDAAVLPPRGIRIFNLPRRDVDSTTMAPLAYRIASNTPITAYQFNPLDNVDVFSNDASLLIPTTSLDREYLVMNRPQLNLSLRGFMTVIGVAQGITEVTVTTTASIGAGEGIARMLANETRTFTLNRFDVLNLEPDAPGADLTGSVIVADKPVVVFSGNEAANAPTPLGTCTEENVCDDDGRPCVSDIDCIGNVPCCADHLEQQLFPVVTWGKEYLAVRSYPRGGELDLWRVLASRDGTTITLDPVDATHQGGGVPVLNRGEFYEFEAAGDFRLTASEPVLLGQFLAGEHSRNAGIGDPAFILVPPLRQLRDSYVFLAPNKYAVDYVSIAVRNASARLDGVLITELADSLPGFVKVAAIGGSEWTAYRVPIEDGFHTLTCPGTCSVMVHGYDQFVSYGYPGGLNLFECLSDGDCRAPTPRCDTRSDAPAQFVCVGCLADEDCDAPTPFCHAELLECRSSAL